MNGRDEPFDPEMIEEAAFLAAYDPAEFERPSLAVDLVLISVKDNRLHVLLLERPHHPHRGQLSLPGTFVAIDESVDAAAARVLETRLSLPDTYIEQLFTFGAPDRDPRMRVVTVAYYALVSAEKLAVLEGSQFRMKSLEVPWDGERGGPVIVRDEQGGANKLAFDHAEIIGMAVKRMRGKLDYAPIGFQMLPMEFTLRQLQEVHETVRGEPVNKDSFRRRMLSSGDLEPTGRLEDAVGHRPAELYRFARRSAL